MLKKIIALSLVSLAAVSTAGLALAENTTDPNQTQNQSQNQNNNTTNNTPSGAPQTGLGGMSLYK